MMLPTRSFHQTRGSVWKSPVSQEKVERRGGLRGSTKATTGFERGENEEFSVNDITSSALDERTGDCSGADRAR